MWQKHAAHPYTMGEDFFKGIDGRCLLFGLVLPLKIPHGSLVFTHLKGKGLIKLRSMLMWVMCGAKRSNCLNDSH